MDTFEVEGQRLGYEVAGDGPPVLWLSNIGAPSGEEAARAAIVRAGHCVIGLDYLGPDDCTVEDVARRVGELLDHLGLDVWVWGFSQGAWIAQELALLRPDRVRGAVLTATRGRLSPFVRLQLEAQQQAAELGSADAFVTISLSTLFDARTLQDDELVGSVVGPMVATVFADRARVLRACRASLAYDNRLDALRAVAVPTLVIRFGDDLKCPPELGREVADVIPGAETVLFEGATHAALSTRGAEVLATGLAFMGRHA